MPCYLGESDKKGKSALQFSQVFSTHGQFESGELGATDTLWRPFAGSAWQKNLYWDIRSQVGSVRAGGWGTEHVRTRCGLGIAGCSWLMVSETLVSPFLSLTGKLALGHTWKHSGFFLTPSAHSLQFWPRNSCPPLYPPLTCVCTVPTPQTLMLYHHPGHPKARPSLGVPTCVLAPSGTFFHVLLDGIRLDAFITQGLLCRGPSLPCLTRFSLDSSPPCRGYNWHLIPFHLFKLWKDSKQFHSTGPRGVLRHPV